MNDSIAMQLSQELTLPEKGVAAVLKLLSEGNTIPFISRYRKEMTGSLDEVSVRQIKERSDYIHELMERRHVILILYSISYLAILISREGIFILPQIPKYILAYLVVCCSVMYIY